MGSGVTEGSEGGLNQIRKVSITQVTQNCPVSSTVGEWDPDIISEEEQSLNPIIILIPVGLVMLIIAAIVAGIVISRRCNAKAKKRGTSVTTDPRMSKSWWAGLRFNVNI